MAAHSSNLAEAPLSQAESTPDLNGARQIVAFVSDTESEAALRRGLFGLADEVQLRRGTLRHAVRHFEKAPSARAVVVDITGVDNPLAGLDELAGVCAPDTKVFVVGESDDVGLYRTLIQDLGVAEYIVKPLTRDNVQRLIAARLGSAASGPASGRGGHVVVVCGARGGVGATTIAANVALDVANSAKGHVALLDLHLQGGTTAMMFGGQPGPGLRIVLEEPERADALFLERTAITVAPRLSLVAAEEPFDAAPAVTEAGVARLLELLRQKFNFVVVDMPMPCPPAMRGVIAQAREVIVVLQPDVGGLRDTNAIRNLISEGAGASRLISVLNRADAKGGLPLAMVQKGLGAAPAVIIPDLGKRMTDAINLGVPALRHVPGLRRYLAPLTRELAGTPTGERRSWLGRMLHR